MFALLVREPFNLSLEQIADLTDEQIAYIYFHPRDDRGHLEPFPEDANRGEQSGVSFADMYARVTRLREPGISDEEISRRLFAEHGIGAADEVARQTRNEVAELWAADLGDGQ